MFAAMRVKVTLVEGAAAAPAVPRPRDRRAPARRDAGARGRRPARTQTTQERRARRRARDRDDARGRAGDRRARSCSSPRGARADRGARPRGGRRRRRQARLRPGRRRLPDGVPERLRRRRRHRLPGARVDVDGAGARRGVPRLRLHLQAAGVAPLAVRHLHDPRGELRRASRRRTAKEKSIDAVVGRAFYRDNARGKIIGDKDGVIKLVFERGTRKLHRLPLHRRARDGARAHRAGA